MRPGKRSIPSGGTGLFQLTRSTALTLVLYSVLGAACASGAPGLDGGGPSESDSFSLSGPIKADSSGEKGGGSCQWTPAVFDLKFTSGQMQNGVQVRFDVTVGVGGVGEIDAAAPAGAGGTALELVAGGNSIPAAQGTVHVTDADLTAKKWKGSIDASFTDGTKLAGTWSCVAS